jgi:hypothetical protein
VTGSDTEVQNPLVNRRASSGGGSTGPGRAVGAWRSRSSGVGLNLTASSRPTAQATTAGATKPGWPGNDRFVSRMAKDATGGAGPMYGTMDTDAFRRRTAQCATGVKIALRLSHVKLVANDPEPERKRRVCSALFRQPRLTGDK